MEFVPLNLGGVFRPLRFVNGLVENNIRPVVITFADNEHLRKVHNRFDQGLVDKLDRRIPVHRIPLSDIDKFTDSQYKRFRNILFNATDNFLKAWEENLFRELPGIIEKYKPKAVLVTCPPFSGAVLGTRISREFNIPLILDMRDAWSQVWAPSGTYLHYLHKEKVERRALEQAGAIITVTPRLKAMFEETHPRIPKEKFRLIYNGFDFELPDSLSVGSESIGSRGTLHIGYIGSFYYAPGLRERMLRPWWKRGGHRVLQYSPVKEDWLYRSPWFFFRSLADLFARRPEWRSRIFFDHIGDTPPWLAPMAKEWGIGDNVILHGFQTHEKTLQLQASFDLLLATSEKVIGNEHYCLPSKLFTYLRSGKPVLGFVTKGIQYDFIRQSGLGVISDPDDTKAGSLMIENMAEKGFDGKLNIPYLREFSNATAINRLTTIIQEVIKENL